MKLADLYKAKALGLEKGGGRGGGDYLELSGGTMSGDINMDGHAVTWIGTPTNASDASTKGYVDDKIGESKDAFVAVYGSTTYEDVVAAIDANKVIMLDMPANHNLFNMTYVTYTNGGNAIMHAIFKMSDRPTLMTATLTPANNWTIAHTDLQDKLVNGTNIKTINNESILGSGNIVVGGGGESGVFLARQHFTTAQELIAAYEAKKVILLETTASPGGYEFVIAQLRKNSGTSCDIVGYRVPDADPTKGIQICRSSVRGSEWSNSAQYVQNRLVSGTNIKTINGESILGEGNLDVGGGTVDSAMSDTSENAVQNKVIKSYVDTEDTALQTQLGDLAALTTDEKTNLVGAIIEVNAKTGQHLEVGVEKWYGTYRESGVTYQVYSKIIKIDALPSTAGITNYPHGITGIKQILSVYGFCTNGMVMNAPRQTLQDNICIYQVQKSGNIAIEVGKDRSSIGGFVVLIYAKNN